MNDKNPVANFLPVLAVLIVLCLAGAAALTLLTHNAAPVAAPATLTGSANAFPPAAPAMRRTNETG